MDQQSKFERFAELHSREGAFLIANAWDAGSAKILAAQGFEALATTSAGYAFSKGKRDSFAALSRSEILENAKEIVTATDLPVSADLEDGFGPMPADCSDTIAQAIAVGLIGGSIEDATGIPEAPIYGFDHAVERVAAAVEAKRGKPFLLTARCENWLWGKSDLDDTIRRLQAFAEAGADVLYAPGLPNLDAITRLCSEVPKPVNVVMGLSGAPYSVKDLSAAGVRRISVGGSFARAALGALQDAAREVIEDGTFHYAKGALPGDELAALMSQARPGTRG